MKKFKKNWIKMNDVETKEEVETTEEKEETEMGFFKKHKKGLIIGGLGTLAAGAVGLFLATRDSSDDDLEEFDDDDFENEEVEADAEAAAE